LLVSGGLFWFGSLAWAQNTACDLNRDGTVNSTDVTLAVDMTLGKQPCTANLNGAGVCNAVTVQRVVNAGLGQPCLVDATLPQGLVAAYAFNEGVGSTVVDVSGNGRTGTISNATWTGAGKYGGALYFNGTTSYVNLGAFDVPGSALTISAWFKADSYPGDPRIVSKATSIAEADHYFMLSVASGKYLRSRLKTSGTTKTLVASSTSLQTGVWIHGAVTYDGSTMRIYKDGLQIASLAVSGSINTSGSVPVWIGRNPDGTNTFHGIIDDVRIYSRALTASEIQLDMNTPLSAEPLPPLSSPSPAPQPKVSLTWLASTTPSVAGYNIYRASVSGGPYTKLNTSLISTTAYVDSSVENGKTYYYVATAVDSSGLESAYSNQAMASIP
jgi:hypothetical protein